MSSRIHPSAVIDEAAEIGSDVEIGPFVFIGPGVQIGDDSSVGPFTRIEGPVVIGRQNNIVGQVSIGTQPQDLKFGGEMTELRIGDGNTFREFVTINRGTAGGGGLTEIGSDNFFMAYSHVAHDCHVGSHTIFANGATLAGHVAVGDHATIGAFSAVHQFCRVGEHAFIGGFTVATQDVLPYVKTVGNRSAKTYGVNTIGLQRKSFSEPAVQALQKAYRILVRSHLKLEEALTRIEQELGEIREVRYLVEFVRGSSRGIIR
ncbi:MAG: acyl-ACP--UDP-N-acetylglucosamine O-acyltransferase [Acidobacteriota bacterium]